MVLGFAAGTVDSKAMTFRKWLITKTRTNVKQKMGFTILLDSWAISNFYTKHFLDIPRKWSLSRKHIRVQTLDNKFVKLNKFESRINPNELRNICIKFSRAHVYFSVLNYLFPERVGKKYKANYAVPINGEYVIDMRVSIVL